MREKAIEPDEIIVENVRGAPPPKSKPQFQVAPALKRLVARLVDYALFLPLLRPFAIKNGFLPLEYLLWIPVEALCLTYFGTTLGKKLLSVQVKLGIRDRFSFEIALRRSFAVWMRGIGCGFLFFGALCAMNAYQRLNILKITGWDLENHVQVSYGYLGKVRWYFAVFVAAAGFLYYYWF